MQVQASRIGYLPKVAADALIYFRASSFQFLLLSPNTAVGCLHYIYITLQVRLKLD